MTAGTPAQAVGEPSALYGRWWHAVMPAATGADIASAWRMTFPADRKFWTELDAAQEPQPDARRALLDIIDEVGRLDEPGPVADYIRLLAGYGLGETPHPGDGTEPKPVPGALDVAVEALRVIALGVELDAIGKGHPIDPSVTADKALVAIRDLRAAEPKPARDLDDLFAEALVSFTQQPQPAPELQAGEIAYLYHWSFDMGDEYGLYRHAEDAHAKAAEHADEGRAVVLSMAILGRPEAQPAPELAEVAAKLAEVAAERDKLLAAPEQRELDGLREQLEAAEQEAADVRACAVGTFALIAVLARDNPAAQRQANDLRKQIGMLPSPPEADLGDVEPAPELVRAMGVIAAYEDCARRMTIPDATARAALRERHGVEPAPELAAAMREARELRERMTELAADLDTGALATEPSKKSEIQRDAARRIRKAVKG